MKNVLLSATVAILLGSFCLVGRTAIADDSSTDEIQTGAIQITLTMTEIGGEDAARAAEAAVAPDEPISWEVFVPESYRPEEPAGLMVYVSPTSSGRMPRRWRPVMEESNMIWLGANESGNKIPVARRVVFAIVAPTVARLGYNIDPERVYVSGFSGGGKVASMLAPGSTNTFKGAIYTCGVEFWDQYPHDPVEQIRQYHYVFVTGTEDFNLKQTKNAYKKYLKSGVENSKLMVIRRMGHKNPDARNFKEAVQYLDSRTDSASTPETMDSVPGPE